jgi:hypothetical protein
VCGKIRIHPIYFPGELKGGGGGGLLQLKKSKMTMIINYWAVLVSAVASMVIGGVWYGPLFGKLFMHIQGWDKRTKAERVAMMKGMVWNYIFQFIASVVMFYVLGVLMYVMGVTGAVNGLAVGLLLWIGFVVPLAFGNTLWGGKPAIFWLSIGNMLLTLLAAGAIVGAWR